MIRVLVISIATLFLGACAHYPVNEPLESYTPDQGYRFSNLDSSNQADSLFVILTFSGGGTRAAAFSYGVMEQLAATTVFVNGEPRRLLDEIDVISSVSGGSFTAAYYGLFGRGLFENFPDQFLYRNVQRALILRALNPLNWLRLASTNFDRIDLAAEYYDKNIFRGQRYSRLIQLGRRPYIILNATDIGRGSRFEFTQSQFDWLYSDLSFFSVARAVAASSAFPGLLSPLRVHNYDNPPTSGDDEDMPLFSGEPEWLQLAIEDADRVDTRFYRAQEIASYTRDKQRPYIHLLDGGLADNIGLRGPLWAMQSTDSDWSLLHLMNREEIDTVLVISVDAKPIGDAGINRKKNAPGLIKVFGVVSTTPMENYSTDTVHDFHSAFDQWRKDQMAAQHAGLTFHAVNLYDVHVGFEEITNARLQDRVKSLPTSYRLKRKQVDDLRKAAADALTNSETFEEFLEAMQ